MHDLHSALKTTVLGKSATSAHPGAELALVKLQHGRNDEMLSVHVRPSGWSTAGLQLTDLLAYLGFERQRCAFIGPECYVRKVQADFDVAAFGQALTRMYSLIDSAEKKLSACGFLLPQPEGWGFFYGKPSGTSRRRLAPPSYTDGHTASKSERMKEAEDEYFRFIFTWLEGGSARGWATHYRPKHPPLSEEMQAALRFLEIKTFAECPEFDFEACAWRFTPYEGRNSFDSNAALAHGWFETHSQNFSPGLRDLLELQGEAQRFGMSLWPSSPSAGRVPRQAAPAIARGPVVLSRADSEGQASSFVYDVALSFAGPQRALAQELAERLREAGVKVFYDDFYPEQLWGKDLTAFFDGVYRKQSRYCVMFISKEYVERMWTIHEARIARARALKDKGGEYILPILVEPADVPGLPDTVAYLPIEKFSIAEIAEFLLKKLRG